MALATTLAVAGLALAAVGTGTQFIAGQKQAKAAQKASELEQRRASAEASRQRRRTIREARIARGQALNVATQVGAGDSSGSLGGLSGLSAQAGANLGFSTFTGAVGAGITRQGQKQASAARLGAIGGGIAGIGGSLFSAGGGFAGVKKAFAPRPAALPGERF